MDRSAEIDCHTVASAARQSSMERNTTIGSRAPASAEMFPGVGFRIRRDFSRLTIDVEMMFQIFGLADISDHLNRLYTVDCSIRCLSGGNRRLVGPACTVKVYPGDNLMVHKALDNWATRSV